MSRPLISHLVDFVLEHLIKGRQMALDFADAIGLESYWLYALF